MGHLWAILGHIGGQSAIVEQEPARRAGKGRAGQGGEVHLEQMRTLELSRNVEKGTSFSTFQATLASDSCDYGAGPLEGHVEAGSLDPGSMAL